MAFALNFLKNIPHDILNFAESIPKPVVGASMDIGQGIYNKTIAPALNLPTQNMQQTQQAGGIGAALQGYSGATGTVGNTLGNVAQTALLGAAPGIGKAVEGAVPGLEGLSGITGTAVRGAVSNAPIGGAFNVASAVTQGQKPSKYAMDFLQGAAGGAALGGIGGAIAGKFIPDAKAQQIAQNDSEKFAEKQLTPVVGPVVAKNVAAAAAGSKDPNIVQNIVGNEVDRMHQPVANQAPPPQAAVPPETPPTPIEGATPPAGQGTNVPEVGTPAGPGGPQLQAREAATGILNEGGTVDEAMNELMTKHGMDLGQANQTISSMMRDTGGTLDKSKVNASLNPQYESAKDNFGVAQVKDNERPVLNAKVAHNQVMRLGNQALQEMDKLNPDDLKLVDELANNNPQDIVAQASDKAQMQKVADTLKTYNDYTQAAGAHLGQDIPYRQNYGVRRAYDQSSPEAQAALENARAKLATTPGYTKGQFFKNYEEAQSFGINRANDNAMQDLAQDMGQRSSNLSQLALAKGLNEAYPDQIKTINSGDIPNGYKQLTIPGGNKLFAPESVATEINKRALPDPATGFWKGYDTVNSNLKNLKLAGGGFHSINVMGSYVGQQLASGKAFTPTGMRDLGTIVKGTFSDQGFKNSLQDLNQKGVTINADAAGLEYSEAGVGADVGQATGIAGKIPVLKQIHDSIFGRQIPLLKLKTFEQQTEGLSRNNPDDLAQMTKIAKQINQNYGGLNRSVQGLTPQQFGRAAKLFLATDYNEGQIRSLVDAFSKGGPEGKLARQVVFGKALLFGGLSTAGAVAGGDYVGKDPKQVAFDILNKVANPKFSIGGYNVGLPTTQVAEVAKPLEQTVSGYKQGNPAQGVENFATARLAALPSLGEQALTNKNFYGQPIYGSDAHGRPISPLTTLKTAVGSSTPIPVSQGLAAGQTGNLGATAANIAGLRVTPQSTDQNLPVGQQTYLDQLKQAGKDKNQISATSDFFGAIRQEVSARKAASSEIDNDLAKGDITAAQSAASKYNQELIAKLKPVATKNKSILGDQRVAQELGSGLIDLSDTSIQSRLNSILQNPQKYNLKTPPLVSQ